MAGDAKIVIDCQSGLGIGEEVESCWSMVERALGVGLKRKSAGREKLEHGGCKERAK